MQPQTKRGSTPPLRFPEFQDALAWEEKPLAKVANVIAGQSPDGSNYNDEGIGTPFYQGKTDFGDIYINRPTKWTTQITKLAEQGDILISVRAPVGALNISTNQICIGRGLAAIQAKQNKWYLYYFLNSIQRFIIGNGGSVFDSINKAQIEAIIVLIPPLREQRKIADCLTSLDDLIATHSQKLAALRAYKKGLLQQLFPAEGEPLPSLRFPEFQDAPEWEERKLGEVATFYNGRAYKQEELLDQGKYKVLRVGNFFTNVNWYYSDLELDENKYCENGDLLYAWSASFGPRIWQGEKVIYHYHIWKVVRKADINKAFLFMVLDYETEKIKSQSANGLGLLHITKGTIESWKCKFPPIEEQQIIADCLTSLDDLIAAQSQKLDTLTAHKKGLLQQLFPSPDEVQQ